LPLIADQATRAEQAQRFLSRLGVTAGDDDALSAPNNLLIGTVSAPTNEPVFLSVVPLEELLLGAAVSF